MAAKKKQKKQSKEKKKSPGKSLKKISSKKSKTQHNKTKPTKKVSKNSTKKPSIKKVASPKTPNKKTTTLKKSNSSKKELKKSSAKKSIVKSKTSKKVTKKNTSQSKEQSLPKSTRKKLVKKAAKKSPNKKLSTKKLKSSSKKEKITKNKVSPKINKTNKLTKADAARTSPQKSDSKPSTSIIKPEKNSTQLSENKTTEKPTPSVSNKINKPKEEITIEKVLKETEETSQFQPIKSTSTETTVFTDTLSDDTSSVYSKISEELQEPPGKFTLEFSCKTAPELLYKFLTDPIELSEWFCDDVNIRNGIYTFVWNGVPQQARLVKQERNSLVRFQWLDKNDGSYFEFSIHKNPLTGDVVLYVTDFSEPEELESNKLWWNTQINKLKTILGLQY
ncbi:MAG: hypothetical protein KatS3mg027_2255 [Bacteroidia bacterium]|nr:MAG: hypothetical protein KatS3mg027_2255 [Bacteroidia bacterium]